MAISLKHAFTSAKTDGPDNTVVQPSDWNDEHTLTQASGKLLGRTTAGDGATEEISAGSGLTLASGSLSANVTSVAGKTGAVTLVVADVAGAAPTASPTFTGTPSCPTFSTGTANTAMANTAFVANAIAAEKVVTQNTYDSTPGSPWSKPTKGTMALIECWGAGGGAGRASTATGASGGGGGAYVYRIVPLSQLGATETVTVGLGGAGKTGSQGSGTVGGNSSFGSWVTAYGGAAGQASNVNAVTTFFHTTSTTAGGGGTAVSGDYVMTAGYRYDTWNGSANVVTYVPIENQQVFNGGAGYTLLNSTTAAAASNSVYGGGGGGGGTSVFGGNGGARASTPTNGAQPGGGGGPASVLSTNGANGGDGRVRITVW